MLSIEVKRNKKYSKNVKQTLYKMSVSVLIFDFGPQNLKLYFYFENKYL